MVDALKLLQKLEKQNQEILEFQKVLRKDVFPRIFDENEILQGNITQLFKAQKIMGKQFEMLFSTLNTGVSMFTANKDLFTDTFKSMAEHFNKKIDDPRELDKLKEKTQNVLNEETTA